VCEVDFLTSGRVARGRENMLYVDDLLDLRVDGLKALRVPHRCSARRQSSARSRHEIGGAGLVGDVNTV
jgi:hypothetical protein